MKSLPWILLAVGWSVAPVHADLTAERKSRLTVKDIVGIGQQIHREERIQIKGGNVRIDDLTFGETWIIRMDKKLLWRVDRMDKTYSEWSFEALAARKQAVAEEIKNAARSVAGSEEEQTLNEILSRFAEADPASVALEEGPATTETAGMACRVLRLKVGDRMPVDACFLEDIPEGRDYMNALAALSCFPRAAMHKLESRAVFPVKGHLRYTWLLDRITAEIETARISREPVAVTEFDLPEKFRKVLYPAFDDMPEPAATKTAPKKDFSEDDIERDMNPFKPNKQ